MKLLLSLSLAILILTPLAFSSASLIKHSLAQDAPDEHTNQPDEQMNQPGNVVTIPNPLGSDADTIPDLLQKIIKWMTEIATPIAVAMILYGAFQMIFAGGNETKYKDGLKTIQYTVIGYAIILVGWGFASLITSILTP